MAVCEIKLEMYDLAESKLIFLANVSPNESNTFEFARLKALKDDTDNAIFYAKKSIEFNSKMLPAYILLGQLYTIKWDLENAVDIFSKAEELKPDCVELYFEWGKSFEHFSLFDDAKIRLEKALEFEPENESVKAHLAFCNIKVGDKEYARMLLDKLSNQNEDIVRLTNGLLEFENGNFEEALKFFRDNDDNFMNCYYVAKCNQKLGNISRARDYYEAAFSKNSATAYIALDYANFLVEQNDLADAKRKLRKTLKYNENNPEILNLLFYVSYILAKDDVCDYNIKEALSLAEKAGADFKYPEQKTELENLLRKEE